MMTSESRRLVQQTWDEVLLSADRAGELFYRRLFAQDPQLARLFRAADMREQGRRLIRGISEAVRELESPGKAWTSGPAREESPHYTAVGAALLGMLEEVLGPRFTVPAAIAWVEYYRLVGPEVRRAALGDPGISRVVPLQGASRLLQVGS